MGLLRLLHGLLGVDLGRDQRSVLGGVVVVGLGVLGGGLAGGGDLDLRVAALLADDVDVPDRAVPVEVLDGSGVVLEGRGGGLVGGDVGAGDEGGGGRRVLPGGGPAPGTGS
ncbi:hypothetical protein ACIRQY_33950 [Streptomyces sp. NPDC101490]|uniref:hypothetical protein n=1 Tax=Streptomyces sp. NPDC101490 TaxID=3366143 RepID=UPI0037F3E8DA